MKSLQLTKIKLALKYWGKPVQPIYMLTHWNVTPVNEFWKYCRLNEEHGIMPLILYDNIMQMLNSNCAWLSISYITTLQSIYKPGRKFKETDHIIFVTHLAILTTKKLQAILPWEISFMGFQNGCLTNSLTAYIFGINELMGQNWCLRMYFAVK